MYSKRFPSIARSLSEGRWSRSERRWLLSERRIEYRDRTERSPEHSASRVFTSRVLKRSLPDYSSRAVRRAQYLHTYYCNYSVHFRWFSLETGETGPTNSNGDSTFERFVPVGPRVHSFICAMRDPFQRTLGVAYRSPAVKTVLSRGRGRISGSRALR